jgi:hypothetical protein
MVTELTTSRQAGRPAYPCSACGEWSQIDDLLLGVGPTAGDEQQRLVEAVREAIEPEFAQVLNTLGSHKDLMTGQLDRLENSVHAAISQAEEQLRQLILALDDEARYGPRLFSLAPLEPTFRQPGWTKRRIRLTLWCEHSRLPVHMLSKDKPQAGVYDIEVPREWLLQAAPWIKAISVVARSLLPVSVAGLQLGLDDKEWKAIGEQLVLTEKSLSGLADLGTRLDVDGPPPIVDGGKDVEPTYADGSVWRTLHGFLREKDPSFGGLEKVRDRNRYLWVHPRFSGQYRASVPEIPTGTEGS